MTTIAGSVIWLTGASSGIGEGLAYELGRRGAKLALSGRNAEKLAQMCEQICSAGGLARPFASDVLVMEELRSTAARIESEMGPIEVVIANAGTHIFTKPENFDSKEYMFLMDTNYGGMLRTFEAVLPSMYARGRGHLLGMASMAGYRGLPRAAAYGASKSAMIHFMESLRFHLKKRGLKVTICNPGFVKTPLTDKNDFHMPFLTDSATAARTICHGLERDAKVITFPRPFNWIMKTMQLIPYRAYEVIIEAIERRMEQRQ